MSLHLKIVGGLALLLGVVNCAHDAAPSPPPSQDPSAEGPTAEAPALSAVAEAPATPDATAGQPAPPEAAGNGPPSAKRAPCQNDQSCNDNEAVSALWGKCTALGVCECRPGFELNPKGRCQPVAK